MGRPTGGVVHKRQGTARCTTGSLPVPVISTGSHGGCLLRQHHSGGLPSHGGWHPVSSPQHLGSGDLALDRIPLHSPGSAVPPGLQQRPRGRPVSPSPAPTFKVVTKPDRVSIFEKTLAGPNSFICHLRQSSLFDLLLTILGSDVGRHGRVSPVLGRSSGLRVPFGGYHSACSREASGLHGDGAHPSGSTLGPAPLVLGPAPAFAGSSSGPTVPSRPLALASVSSSLPGSPSAQASCGTPGVSLFPPCVVTVLLRSFRLSSAERVLSPPAWDLSKVLTYLVSPALEPLSQAFFRALPLKTLFLMALAIAKRVGELQALSSIVIFVGGMPACLTSRSLSPSRSCSPVPSLAPSW